MRDLISNKSIISNQILYIIGNGFDLAHGMRTSYEDFHQWLLNSGEANAVFRLESLYPNLKDYEGRWCDVESALGSISIKKAIDFDKNYQDCPDEINGEDSSYDAYRCGENLKRAVDILPGLLRNWVDSIDIRDVCPQFDIDKNAKFLSFNYTRTLEDVYQVESDKVCHIHETIMDNRPLVVGYGDAVFEDEEFVTDDETIDVELIKNILTHNRKPVGSILKEPKPQSWFKSLNSISSVIVFGHSCSEVDKPYFQVVADSIRADAHWFFYVHNKSKNKSIENYAQSSLSDSQTIEIINL